MYHTLKYCQHQLWEHQIDSLPLQPPPFFSKGSSVPTLPCAPERRVPCTSPGLSLTGFSILPNTNQSLEKVCLAQHRHTDLPCPLRSRS